MNVNCMFLPTVDSSSFGLNEFLVSSSLESELSCPRAFLREVAALLPVL